MKESYGFDTDLTVNDINRRCAPSRYAVAQGAFQDQGPNKNYYTADNKGACWWWLRSPGYDCDRAAGVNDDGSVGNVGFVYLDDAVRPVLFLDLKS